MVYIVFQLPAQYQSEPSRLVTARQDKHPEQNIIHACLPVHVRANSQPKARRQRVPAFHKPVQDAALVRIEQVRVEALEFLRLRVTAQARASR